jgi:hypothetical protein
VSHPGRLPGPTAAERVGLVAPGPAGYGHCAVTTKKDYSVVVEGVDALDLSMATLRDLCDLFVEGSQRSARLVAEGRSAARGAVPAWITVAADCRITRFSRGSLDLGIRAGRLVDVAPEIFAQQTLFPAGTDPDATAVDLFLDAMEDAAKGRRDSERLDAGVLDVLTRAGNLLSKGATRLSVGRPDHPTVVLDATTAPVIRTLAEQTPAARISRVRGLLDTLTVTTKAIAVRLDDGRTIRGFAGAIDQDELKALLGTAVVIEGPVNFRPSGQALRIEVESIAPATPGDVIWAQLPNVEASLPRPRLSTAAPDLDALFGTWPGDETDQQLVEALRELQ